LIDLLLVSGLHTVVSILYTLYHDVKTAFISQLMTVVRENRKLL